MSRQSISIGLWVLIYIIPLCFICFVGIVLARRLSGMWSSNTAPLVENDDEESNSHAMDGNNSTTEENEIDYATLLMRYLMLTNTNVDSDQERNTNQEIHDGLLLQTEMSREEREGLEALHNAFGEMETPFVEAGLKRRLRDFFLNHFETQEKVTYFVQNGVDQSSALNESPRYTICSQATDDCDGSDNSVEECAICLEHFRRGDRVIASTNHTCLHLFHEICILPCLMARTIERVLALDVDDEVLEADCDMTSMPCPCCRRWFCILSTKERDELWKIQVQCSLLYKP